MLPISGNMICFDFQIFSINHTHDKQVCNQKPTLANLWKSLFEVVAIVFYLVFSNLSVTVSVTRKAMSMTDRTGLKRQSDRPVADQNFTGYAS